MDNQNYLRKSHAHRHRKDLTGEHKWGDMGQLILLIIFLTVWIMDSFIFKWSSFLTNNISPIIRISLAGLFLIISGYLAYSGLKTVFGGKIEEPKIINTGVFSIIRHPIYLSVILLDLGLIIFTFSFYSILIWVIIIIFYYKISKFEEKLLIARFGQEYEEYIKKVPMFLPIKCKKYKNTDRF